MHNAVSATLDCLTFVGWPDARADQGSGDHLR